MEQEGNVGKDCSSDNSSQSSHEVHVDLHGVRTDSPSAESHGRQTSHASRQLMPTSGGLQEDSSSMSSLSAIQFQEMVIRALFQSTAALVGSSSGLLHHAGESSIGFPTLQNEDPRPSSTWNKAAYRQPEARRNRKPEMMRTSAGEESDSQADFPLPKNATSEQRALRTRRLNRCRAKKAWDLTSNRKALKKLPYGIHVDGSSKPKGIHRHKWKAAVRGQCGRLDPSKDNMRRQPKHVVDSIWHALEREWEFEGFAHKAREMFEKSATTFMHNKKMQLKYKCQKNVDGPRPDDVNGTHWAKIVDITKKSLKEETACTSRQTVNAGKTHIPKDAKEGKQLSPTVEMQRNDDKEVDKYLKKSISVGERSDENELSFASAQTGGSEHENLRRHLNNRPMPGESLASEEEDVDNQIKNLRSQFLWLENSKKNFPMNVQPHVAAPDNFNDVPLQFTKERGTMNTVRKVLEAMKENRAPPSVLAKKDCIMYSRSTGKMLEQVMQTDPVNGGSKLTALIGAKSRDKNLCERICDANQMECVNGFGNQIECGDIITMTTTREGAKEDIGKGVLMSFAGSKFAWKIIPKGWCTIQVSSYTTSGGSEDCPCPAGWKDQAKQKTVKDAEGRIILWPDNLVHM